MSINTAESGFTSSLRLLHLWALLGAVFCHAQSPETEGGTPADAFLARAAETPINDLVLNAIRQGGPGTLGHLRGRAPLDLSVQGASEAAQGKNIQIQASQQDKEVATESLRESEAIFDPLLNLSGGYTRVDSYERSEAITRERTMGLPLGIGTVPDVTDEEGNPVNADETLGTLVCVTVDEVLVNAEQCSLNTEIRTEQELASFSGTPTEAWDFGFGATQLFPWGSILEAQFQSIHRIKEFFNLDPFGLFQPLSLDDPIGQDSRFPWTTSFLATLNTPLPFSRNFGPYGFFPRVGVMLAEHRDRQADWAVAASGNSVLRDVDGAYWELVRSIKLLQITIEQRKVLEGLVEHAQVLFQAGAFTTYDKAQVEADLEDFRNREQIAWNNYIAASNTLVDLLDYEGDTIIVPVDYSNELKTPVTVDSGAAFTVAMEHRPEIKVSQLDVEASDILFKHRKVQTLPDLSLSAGVFLNQSDAVLGYKDWTDSFANVFDPDQENFFVAVNFRIPLGNRAVKSALSQARIQRDQATDQNQQTVNGVIQELNTVIAAVYSTEATKTQTKINLELAQLAYDKAGNLIDQGLITSFELLRKLNDLFSARSAYINTLVDHKKTWAQLLAAQGVLATRY
ncbi:MAG: TolC family protein [Gammaproteobacteria bacterium]